MEKKISFSKNDTLVIKGVTILFLLFHHCFLSGRFEEYGIIFEPIPQKYMVIIAAFLKICVGMFVFLSGFGMFKSYQNYLKNNEDKTIKNYILHRYISLLSNWFFVFTFCEVICFILNRLQFTVYGTERMSVLYFIIDAIGLADFFHTPLLIATWWYMSLAFCLILIFPLIIWVYRKIDVFIFPLSITFFTIISYIYFPLARWMGAFVLGIYCADHKVFEKLKEVQFSKSVLLTKTIKLLLLTFMIIELIRFRQSKGHYIYYFFNDGIIPMFLIYFCYEFINDIKYLNSVLMFIGKHSMNIFLTHSFIRYTYLQEWTYHFRYWWIIIIVLLVESILVSLLINKLSKLLHYNELIKRIEKKILIK